MKHSVRSQILCILYLVCIAGWAAPQSAGQTTGDSSTQASVPASVPVSQSTSPANSESGGFLSRLAHAYESDWNGTADAGPDAPRRGYPAPVSSPPFPFADWPYGGSPVIGAPDTNVPPLMTAL